MSKRVGIYLRVSTSDQNTEIQNNDLLTYVQARGWNIVNIYEDKSSGTTTKKRPEFKKLMAAARERRVDVILVWKLDRFGRSLKDLVVHLQEISELGIDFVSFKDNLDFSTSIGRLMVHLLGAFAEFEASVIRSRVQAGVDNARKKGKILGRPKLRNDDSIKDLRDQGLSFRAIAKELGVSLGSVQRALKVVSKSS
jgi:putative DNA-invertase from lambdoid prophage Rac